MSADDDYKSSDDEENGKKKKVDDDDWVGKLMYVFIYQFAKLAINAKIAKRIKRN